MFLVKHIHNRLHHSTSPFDPSLPPILSQKSSTKVIDVVDTKFELKTRVTHDLGELLCLKTWQIDKYGNELFHKSNFYRRHQMVRSFLWMQLNKEKDNPQLNRQRLAQLVTQNFNKKRYTARKVIQWKRFWVQLRIIPNIKAGNKKEDLS